MYKQTVILSPGETLQLEWGKNYADFTIKQNGQLIGFFPDKASLKLGSRFNLIGDGQRQITVILSEQGMEVWSNEVDLLSGMKSGESNPFSIDILSLPRHPRRDLAQAPSKVLRRRWPFGRRSVNIEAKLSAKSSHKTGRSAAFAFPGLIDLPRSISGKASDEN